MMNCLREKFNIYRRLGRLHMLLLCALMLGLISNPAQAQFPITTTGTCSGTTLNFNHNVALASGTTDITSDVTFTFCLTGDYGSSTNGEGVNVTGEGGTSFGFFNRDDSDNPSYPDCGGTAMCISFTINAAQWNLWNNDGTVNLTIIPTNPVNFCTNYSCLGNVTADISVGPGGLSSNLSIWLKGDYGVYEDAGATDDAENGDLVQQWNDRSTGGHNVVDVQAPAFETDARNYNPGLDFDGANDEMVNNFGGFYMEQYYIVFVADDAVSSGLGGQTVVSADNLLAADYDHEFALGNSTGGYVNEVFSQNVGTTSFWRSGFISTTTSFPAGTPFLFNVKENVAGTATEMYQDGLSLTQTTSNAYLVETDRPFMVGNNFNNDNQFFDGQVLEVISYDTKHTAVESRTVESYLAVKYGITLGNNASTVDYLSSGGSTIWSGDMRYQNDIIGVGRDDLSELLQKQSKTFDDSTRIYMSTLTATNELNTTTDSDYGADEAYVLMGHNLGGMHSTVTSMMEMPAGVYSRLEREWKTTNTNFTGTYSMDFVLSASGDPGNVTVSDLRLLVDDDGDFSDATVHSAGLTFSYAGGVITVSGVSTSFIPANSTRYITIASANAFTPLPIELLTFDAKLLDDGTAEVTWTTSSEINNDYFSIQRSVDGQKWENIGKVPGAGNSSILLEYAFIDDAPAHGVSYYRLKQTDFDGSYSYSDIRRIEVNSIGDIKLFPNPVQNRFTIALDGIIDAKLTIIDHIGKAVRFDAEISTNEATIILEEVASGTYYIIVQMGEERKTEKFIVE